MSRIITPNQGYKYVTVSIGDLNRGFSGYSRMAAYDYEEGLKLRVLVKSRGKCKAVMMSRDLDLLPLLRMLGEDIPGEYEYAPVSVGRMNRGVSHWINVAAYGYSQRGDKRFKKRVLVTNYNRPETVILGYEDDYGPLLERLERRHERISLPPRRM